MDSPLQSYADWDAAQNSGGEFHGASERKEQPDAVREAAGTEMQMPKLKIPVTEDATWAQQ